MTDETYTKWDVFCDNALIMCLSEDVDERAAATEVVMEIWIEQQRLQDEAHETLMQIFKKNPEWSGKLVHIPVYISKEGRVTSTKQD